MKILYKYVTAERAMTCLPEVGDGTLRATQPIALNDPFECAMSFFVNDSKGMGEEAEVDAAYARALTDIHPESAVTSCMVSQARETYGSLYARELLANQLSNRFGIVSFSADQLNPLMWSHYTTDGSGFVIGYDPREFRKLARTRDRLQPVQYDTQPCLLGVSFDPVGMSDGSRSSDFDWSFLLIRKSQHWDYEQEWRLIVDLDQTIGTGQKDLHGQPVNLVRVPNEAVVSVFYTERTPHEAVDELRKRLANPNNRYTAEPLRKLMLAPNSYSYVEEKLN